MLRKSLRQNIRYIAIRFADSVLVRGRRACIFAKNINPNSFESHPINTPPAVDWRPIKNDELSLVFVGKLQKSKGIFELCKCVRELSSEGYTVKLDVIGSGLDHKEIELLYVSDVFTDIIFHGWLDDREHIDQLISHADLAVFPSQENGPEGIPRVIEEALMIGVPVLITPHTVFLENNLIGSVCTGCKWI